MKKARLLFIGASLTILAGCQTTSPLSGSAQEAKQLVIEQQIDDALKRVSDQPRWASSLDDKASFASFNTDSVNVSYQGSAADLLKAVAASRGEAFKVTGPQPHTPIFVFVETEGQDFKEFLQDLSTQFGQRADAVWSNIGFELRYR